MNLLMAAAAFVTGQLTSTSREQCEIFSNCEETLSTVTNEIRQLRQQIDMGLSVRPDVAVAFGVGWKLAPSVRKYYTVIFELVDWDTANARCRELDSESHLVVINDNTENDAIKRYLSSFNHRLMRICYLPEVIMTSGGLGIWTSGQRANRSRCENEQWVWKPNLQTMLPMTFKDFRGKQPDCFNGTEHCLLYQDSNLWWNDMNCRWLACPLCERAL
jgi:hypothetical protein